MSTPDGQRSHPLDVLRGVAIVLVLFNHLGMLWNDAVSLNPVLERVVLFGWTGVDLFFVLSGFLVGGLLFREAAGGSVDVSRFLARRAWKIWPPYFALLAYAVWRERRWLGTSWRTILAEYWPNLLHVQNYRLTPLVHTWSLAVEEHFYLLLPIGLAVACRRAAVSRVPLACAAVMAVVLCARYLTFWDHPGSVPQFAHYTPTHIRIDSLAFGVLLAHLSTFRPQRFGAFAVRFRTPLVVGGAALITPVVFSRTFTPFTSTFGYTLLYLGFGAILVSAMGLARGGPGRAERVVWSRPFAGLAFVGRHSYSIYLWHVHLGVYPASSNGFARLVSSLPANMRFAVSGVVYMALALVAGVAMSYLIERPALWLRDRLAPRRAPGPAADAAAPPADDEAVVVPAAAGDGRGVAVN